ncbi:hypothetical protein RQN30_01440 [Arcanobacterium hippocoleae]
MPETNQGDTFEIQSLVLQLEAKNAKLAKGLQEAQKKFKRWEPSLIC